MFGKSEDGGKSGGMPEFEELLWCRSRDDLRTRTRRDCGRGRRSGTLTERGNTGPSGCTNGERELDGAASESLVSASSVLLSSSSTSSSASFIRVCLSSLC